MDKLEFSTRSIGLWNKLGPRATYGSVLNELAKYNDEVIALSADLGNSSGLDRFKADHPDRFIQIGVAEQNMIGVAAGLANEGFIPFVSSFAPFITMRAAEQVRMNLGYMEQNVKLVGIGSGLSMGFLGNSHYGLEDIAVMRAIPNMMVISPCDGYSIAKTLEQSIGIQNPMYIRLTGLPNMISIYSDTARFQIGKANQIGDGHKIAILSNGAIIAEVLNSSKELLERSLANSIFDFHTIRPFDIEQLKIVLKEFEFIFVVEEHFETGGLFSAVTESMMRIGIHRKIVPICIPSEFGLTGDYNYGLEVRGLKASKISSMILDHISQT